jgi:methyl-accepting chemotaxis protein
MHMTGGANSLPNRSPTIRRKRMIVVNRDLQLRYTGAAVLVGTLTTLLTTFFILLPLYTFKILVIPRFLPLPFLILIAMALLMNILAVFVLGLMLTNRIAGPLYSLVRAMRQTGRGDFNSHLTVRSNDDLKFVIRHFNDMSAGLHRMTKDDIESVDKLMASINDLHNRLGSDPSQQSNAATVTSFMTEVNALRLKLSARVDSPAERSNQP